MFNLESVEIEEARKYLIHHIDKRLSVIPAQTLNHLSIITVGEDICDQGDSLIRTEGTINQAFPHWNSATREKMIRQTSGWLLQASHNVQCLWAVEGFLMPALLRQHP